MPQVNPEINLGIEILACENCNTTERQVRIRPTQDGESERLCEECFTDQFSICGHCNQYSNGDSFTELENDSLCQGCFDNLARGCESCGDIFYRSNLTEGNCDSCLPETDESGTSFQFSSTFKKTLGITGKSITKRIKKR